MSKIKKYSFTVEQHDDTWRAKIVRQVTSKKTVVSKMQEGFSSEADANDWAEKQLAEFTSTLSASNKRHSEQRKSDSQNRLQRSARRAEKTQSAKELEAEKESNPEDQN